MSDWKPVERIVTNYGLAKRRPWHVENEKGEDLRGPGGRVRKFKTFKAAQQAADKANGVVWNAMTQ